MNLMYLFTFYIPLRMLHDYHFFYCNQVAFFSDQEETQSTTPKADAFFMPRENPRALVIRSSEHWPARISAEKPSPLKDTSVQENGIVF